MALKETDPIEVKSYGKWLFALGSLFLLVSLWAYFDEFIGRRTWKWYQRGFNRLELKLVEQEYRQAKEAWGVEDKRLDEAEEGLSLREIRLKLEEAEVQREGPEYRKGERDLLYRKNRLTDASQRLGFTKADQDEIFYEWKHAIEEGHQEIALKNKSEYDRLQQEITDHKKKVEAAEKLVAGIQTELGRYDHELKKWRDEEKKYLGPLKQIEKRIASIRSRTAEIHQVVIEDLGKEGVVQWGTVDRCQSCHAAINRAGFEEQKNPFKTHPFREEIFSKHPAEKFGCVTCHGGQGRATQIKHQPLEEGDFAHGIEEHWRDPLRRGDALQSTCNKCHQDQWRLDHAPVYMAGKKLFWDRGCTGCHIVEGFEEAPKVGPSLRKVGGKVNPEWLIRWIKDPKAYLPKTFMPKPPLDIEAAGQSEKVAAYLWQASEPYPLPFGRFPGGDPNRGKILFETVGCLGCHELKANQARSAVEGEAPSGLAGGGGDASPYDTQKGTGLAPALDRITEKTTPDWIFNWIQDPKIYNPDSRMPSLRLSRDEAADITAYLARQGQKLSEEADLRLSLGNQEKGKAGYLLVSQFGCYGCHEIKGFENASKLSVELTDFGKKETTVLDFGDTHIPRTWQDWTSGKLKDPRQYLTERTTSKMPNFGLSDEEIHSLIIFLKGLRKEKVPEGYRMTQVHPEQAAIDQGRRLTERLHCRGCHTIEGEGRLIQPFLGENDGLPPLLDGIGARVRPDWMFSFLKDPSRQKVRPWVKVRMPTFGFDDHKTNLIIRYFSGLSKVRPDFYSPTKPPEMTPEARQAAAKLLSSDFFSCYSCHARGGVPPPGSPGQWGPDLSLAHDRIRPEFIPEWLKDPQKFTPGVVMPGFLPDDSAAPQEILGGSSQKQAEAIRDYLMGGLR